MMCRNDDLLALIRGELDAERTAEVEKHVAACDACHDELGWLRAEKELFARRAAAREIVAPPVTQWPALADKIAVARERADAARLARRRRRAIFGGPAGLLAAAAAVVLLVIPEVFGPSNTTQAGLAVDGGTEEPGPSPRDLEDDEESKERILKAIRRAESEYDAAIDVLDTEYAAQREKLPPAVARLRDNEIRRLRTELEEIRGLAGDDVDGRLRALQATAVYVRSMQKLLIDDETAASPRWEETP
jgi:hypothetical protein